jgi:hypothetical protein
MTPKWGSTSRIYDSAEEAPAADHQNGHVIAPGSKA